MTAQTQPTAPETRGADWVCPPSLTLEVLEEYLKRVSSYRRGDELRINFSETSWFDVAALVFLLCILSNLRTQGVAVTIRLPDPERQKKARDFLVRWNFRGALLRALDNELANILPVDQLTYFDSPATSYPPAEVVDEYGALTVLSSLRLLQISSLTDLNTDGNYRVSFSRIGEITDRASAQAIYSALQNSIGASKEWATKFGRVLVHQALLNAFEHPDATVAFIAMARQQSYLVVGIADNGLTIPHTISEAYEDASREGKKDNSSLSAYQLDANRISFSTHAGTTRKRKLPSVSVEGGEPERGMGLYYIKTLAAEVGGFLVIRASEASVAFRSEDISGKLKPEARQVARLERGNLLKIFLPLKNPRMTKNAI